MMPQENVHEHGGPIRMALVVSDADGASETLVEVTITPSSGSGTDLAVEATVDPGLPREYAMAGLVAADAFDRALRLIASGEAGEGETTMRCRVGLGGRR